jgi:HlyD family secretion protein
MKGQIRTGASRLLTGLLLLGSALTAAACGRGEASEAPAIQTMEVARATMRITAEATGQVEPIRQVEVKSKASGEILRLYADIGDKVDPGTLLADIDPRDVRNGFDQAEADLEVARARVDISDAQLQRSTELLEAGVITQQEYEGQRLDYANARASLVKAETNLELAELRLSDVTIRAPISGTILTRNVEEGTVIQSASSNVSGGTTLFVMANLDEMQVRTLVDETDVGQIRAGLTASVQVEAFPGRTFQGVVEKIEPQATVQQNVTMFPVIVRLDNRQGLLKPGMNAEVETLLVERPEVLVVPNNAVVLPQEMAPAASILGMDPEGIEFTVAFTQRWPETPASGGGKEWAGIGSERRQPPRPRELRRRVRGRTRSNPGGRLPPTRQPDWEPRRVWRASGDGWIPCGLRSNGGRSPRIPWMRSETRSGAGWQPRASGRPEGEGMRLHCRKPIPR